MEQTLKVAYPKELAFSLNMQDFEFISEMKKLAIIKLYEIGKISSGIAAKTLNIERIEFLELLNHYNVSIFSFMTEADILQDLKNA